MEQLTKHNILMEVNILIIKFGALGDVLRTTCILHGLRRAYPKGHITWVVEDNNAFMLLKDNKYIAELLLYGENTERHLINRKFDLILSLDEDRNALSLATALCAREKIGYGLNEAGDITVFSKESEYAFRLRIDDDLKFRKNTLTYQEIIFRMAQLDYHHDEYILTIPDEDLDFARGLMKRLTVYNNDFVIGLNTGAGPRFANKAWTTRGYADLIKRINERLKAKVLLLGGPEETERNKAIEGKTKGLAYSTGSHNTISQFAAIVNCCDCIVSGDTSAIHIAVALKKLVVAIFGPTCPQEIDLYGRGVKIVSKVECAPCYKGLCDKKVTCMDKISTDEIFAGISTLIPKERLLQT